MKERTMKEQLKQFLLALINATLVLCIILVISGIVLVSKVNSLTTDVISEVKVELLQEIEKNFNAVAGSVIETQRNLDVVAKRLNALAETPEITLPPETQKDIRAVRVELEAIRQGVTKLTSLHDILSDEAIRKISATLADSFVDFRRCRLAGRLSTPLK